ncbi:hypothetical protein PVAND_000312 [Polypedilum vanderplanki]|uniref:Peptidase S1 domain-containing protein n=1 Tax=Polypedilum vanderplanki TaxID=319348 RepID=A0A9J6BJG8_POLVA|nr:hypothetical protein PVAND_000312 [Polypedilum vanderplanki]
MKIFIILLLATVAFANTFNNMNKMTIDLQEPPKELREIAAKTILNRQRRSTDAVHDQFKFIAELAVKRPSNKDLSYCTGSLFKPQWIITSLKCIGKPSLNNVTDLLTSMEVYLGEITSQESERREKAYAIHGEFMIPNDDFPNYPDISIFKLSREFKDIPHISPINIPTIANSNFTDTKFVYVAWKLHENIPDKVIFANFTIDKTPAECQLSYYLLCASAPITFEADPGAAFVTYNNASVGTLIGIYSDDGVAAIIATNLSWFLSFLNV